MHRQKLREQELELEEKKRRQQEVRELARKEMERQRQRELEQAKRSELLAQRTRLMDEISKLKSKKKILAIEHEKIDKDLMEKKSSAQKSREKVVAIKGEIDGMRIKRDQILAKQSQIKSQIKSLTDKQLFVEQEKVRLASQLKSLIANTSNELNPDQQLTSFASILEAKQSQLNQLRSQVERAVEEFRMKKDDVANSKKELEQLKKTFQEKRQEALTFSERLEQKRCEAERVRDGKAQSKFASDSDVAWGQEVPTNFEWPATNELNDTLPNQSVSNATIRTKFRYRCVFEFEARNSDEITIKPGDIIMVDTSACSEEGWLSGEINGKIGWFPKDYAVEDEESAEQLRNDHVEPNELIQEAVAIYDYSSEENGHLSFKKDDRLRITQQQESWYFGELINEGSGSKKFDGWFPKNHVKIIDSGVETAPKSANKTDFASSIKDLYFISLYAFETVEPGDLGFDVDEIIKVEKQEGDWWTGVIIDRSNGNELSERRGIFPSNFVGPIDYKPPNQSDNDSLSLKSTAKAPSSTATSLKAHQSLDRKESDSVKDSSKPSKKSKTKKLEIVTAVAAYTATGPEQLSLEVGQLIQVRKKTQTGWWEGELQAKGKKKQIGWFPASYIKPFGSSSNNSTSESSKSATEEPEIERVQALYNFNAQRDDEISFVKDDIIRVLSKSDPTWWRGHNTRTDAVGLFPSNHIQVLSSEESNKVESDPIFDEASMNFRSSGASDPFNFDEMNFTLKSDANVGHTRKNPNDQDNPGLFSTNFQESSSEVDASQDILSGINGQSGAKNDCFFANFEDAFK
ncbi:Intersectin-2 [Sarcoptes scabiei]|nr:Intersectin-2 [Sarcoptes scabiei]